MRSTSLIALLLVLLSMAAFAVDSNPDIIVLTRMAEGAPPLETYAEYMARRGPFPLYSPDPALVSLRRGGAGDDLFVLINDELYPYIQDNYELWQTDLVADGYNVHTYTSPVMSPEALREWLIVNYNTQGLDGVLLIGEFESAWFQHQGQGQWYDWNYEEFPCDLFLMDLTGEWRDDYDRDGNPVPDGIYDYHGDGDGCMKPDIYLGRVTAYNLPLLGEEADLVNAWLQRVHAFRNGGWVPDQSSMSYVDYDWRGSGYTWGGHVAYVYPDNEALVYADWSGNPVTGDDYKDRLQNNSYENILMCCHSSPHVHQFHAGSPVYTYHLYYYKPQWAFHNLFACSNVRYTTDNNMGAIYAFHEEGAGLLSVGSAKTGSMLEFQEYYGAVRDGMTWGEAFSYWMSLVAEGGYEGSYGEWEQTDARGWFYGMTFIGDPTLRPSTYSSVELIAFDAEAREHGVLLSWALEEGAGSTLELFRLVGDNERRRLNDRPLSADVPGRYLDTLTDSGRFAYILQVTDDRGRVYEYGPVECDFTAPGGLVTRLVGVNPNPVRNSATVTLELAEADAGVIELALYDLAGRRVATLHQGALTAGRHALAFEVDAYTTGVYLLRLRTDSSVATGRLVISR